MGTSESEHNSKDHNESDDVISGELEQNNDSDNNGAEDVVAELVSSFLNTAPRGHRRVASSPALYTTSTSPQGHHRRTSSRYSDRSHRRTGSRYSGRSHRRMPTPLFGDDIVEEGTLFRKPSTGGYSYNSRYHEEDYDSDDFSTESSSGDGPPEHMEEGHLEQPDEKEERMRRAPPKLVRQESMRQLHGRRRYNWRKFLRARTIKDIFHWLAYGFVSDMKQSREEMLQDLANLARLLKMLRDYYDRFGLPAEGGPRDQEHVLRVVTKELYSSGCPVWALESVMQQVSEGLTGNQGVDFLILPKKVGCFVLSSSSRKIRL